MIGEFLYHTDLSKWQKKSVDYIFYTTGKRKRMRAIRGEVLILNKGI